MVSIKCQLFVYSRLPLSAILYFLSLSNLMSHLKPESINRSLKPALSSHELTKEQKTPVSKIIQRKPRNLAMPSNLSSKDVSKERRHQINSSRYVINTPVISAPMAHSVTTHLEPHEYVVHDLKTERKETNEKSMEKTSKQKRYNDDSADYYKYWKKKANDYQQINFTLHRLNSDLQEENQILKHKLEKMERKVYKLSESEPSTPQDQAKNYEKLEAHYRAKVDQLSRKIEEQQIHISKQDKKIKQLSKYISENYQLKNILDNMEEKLSEMKSVGSKDSRADSIEKTQQKEETLRPKNMTLRIDYKEHPNLNKAKYVLKGNKYSQNFNDLEVKSTSNRRG